ncbi:hypothetical protein CNR22_16550 [Sphingobacteriaceae bacterium]|nr:hypothetical protein CNR22_16550 [Sphingobacteriaceae bacterium]
MKNFSLQKFGIGLCLILLSSGMQVRAQTPSWAWARTGGSSGMDYAGGLDYNSSTIATDANGNSYMTGLFNGTASFGTVSVTSPSHPEVFVAKYDLNGICLWVRHFGGNDPDVYGNEGKSIAVDASGNCYVTGTFHGSVNNVVSVGSFSLSGTGKREIFTVKYDANGNEQWANQPSNSGTMNNYAKSITVDGSGNSYITGYLGGGPNVFGTTAALSGPGAYIIMYNSSGVAQWSTKLGNGNADALCVANDVNGNAYVSGYLQNTETFAASSPITLTSTGMRDVFLAKIGSTGILAWVKQFGVGTSTAPSTPAAYGKGISVDGLGNIFLTGDYQKKLIVGSTTLLGSGPSSTDAFIAKFDLNGNPLWAYSTSNANGTGVNARGTGVKANNAGDCFFTGYYYPSSGPQQNTPSFCGLIFPSSGNQITYVIKINAGGSTAWGQFSSGVGSSSIPAGISIDQADNVYIAGNNQGTQVMGSTTITSNGGYDVLIAKIGNATLTTGIKNDHSDNQSVLIYPNPFNVYTTIDIKGYDAKKGMNFKVYNLLGEVVRSYSDISSSFRFEKGDISTGIYSYVLSENNTPVKSGKIVVQ